jgi:environmental stress-induced protein Ves
MKPRLIRRADLAMTKWRNGAGRKSDIATGPGWLVGFAFLDQDAPFSEYPGVDRTITLVEGPGFVLDFAAAAPALVVSAPFEPRPFDGEMPTQCRIAGGACVVLNAVTERAAWTHSVAIGALPAGEVGPSIVVVLRGEVASGGETAGFRDSWHLSEPAVLSASADAMVAMIRILAA